MSKDQYLYQDTGQPSESAEAEPIVRQERNSRPDVNHGHIEETIMGSTSDKIKGAANEVAGKARQVAGRAVNNHEEQAKGALQEAKGKVQVAKGNAKEAIKSAVDKA